MRFRRKAETVDAFQVTPEMERPDGRTHMPLWAQNTMRVRLQVLEGSELRQVRVLPEHGNSKVANVGDWVVSYTTGGMDVVDRHTFARTYEPDAWEPPAEADEA